VYTATVIYRLPAPVERVWRYISEANKLHRWFARTGRFAAGEEFVFDFGDGDFHNGVITEWFPNISWAARWQFLGMGPHYHIRFSLLPRKNDTELAISDQGALSLDEALCLRLGWTEFCMRLHRVLEGELNARFKWRKDFNVTARFADAASPQSLIEPCWYIRTLNAQMTAVCPDSGIMTIQADRWHGVTTTVRVRQQRVGNELYTEVQHNGFSDLPGDIGPAERTAAATAWINGLRELGGY